MDEGARTVLFRASTYYYSKIILYFIYLLVQLQTVDTM